MELTSGNSQEDKKMPYVPGPVRFRPRELLKKKKGDLIRGELRWISKRQITIKKSLCQLFLCVDIVLITCRDRSGVYQMYQYTHGWRLDL